MLINSVFTVVMVAMTRFSEFPIELLSVIDLYFVIGGLIFWIGCSYFVKWSNGFHISEEGVSGNLLVFQKKITWDEKVYYKKSFLTVIVYRNQNVMPSMILPSPWQVSNLPEIRDMILSRQKRGFIQVSALR